MPAVVPIIAGIATYAATRYSSDATHNGTRSMINAERERTDAEDRARLDALDEARRREKTDIDTDYDHYYQRYLGARDIAGAFGFSLPDPAQKHEVPPPPPPTRPEDKASYQYYDTRKHGTVVPPPSGTTGPSTTPTQSVQSPSTSQSSQGASQTQAGAVAFIRDWQRSHSPSEGTGPLLDALRQHGFDAASYQYGQTPSRNEISLYGQKFKLIGAEDSSTPYWYTGGNDSGGRGGGAKSSTLAALFAPQDSTFAPISPEGAPQFQPVLTRRPLTLGSVLGGRA